MPSRPTIVDFLRCSGCAVVEAASGEAAVDVLQLRDGIDVVFTEIQLGGTLDGWDVGETSRATHPTIPVIYTSGAVFVRDRSVSGSLFLDKPYDPGDRARGLSEAARSNVNQATSGRQRTLTYAICVCPHFSNFLDFLCGGRASEGRAMGRVVSDFIQTLVTEEVRRVVAEAIETGSIVSAAAVAEQIGRTYVNCGLSENEIADQVMIAAAKSGLAVEIGGERMIANPGRTTGKASGVSP
jgi:CheY-like chemotaxis protein